MTYLNITTLLDQIQLRIIDNSTATRERLLAWTNEAMRELVTDTRDWRFLLASTTGTPSNNQLDLSALTDYERINSIYSTQFCLYPPDRASSGTISAGTSGGVPVNFSESGQIFTFYPGCGSETITAVYVKTFTDYTDTSQTTIFPDQCRNALIRMVLATFYEFDADDRAMGAYQLKEAELKKLRDWDNRLKPVVNYDKELGARNYVNE